MTKLEEYIEAEDIVKAKHEFITNHHDEEVKIISFDIEEERYFVCNECHKKYHSAEEPDKCTCGTSNFGIVTEESVQE